MDEDIKLMKQLRLKTYSMTISWARLFRNGFGDTSDPDPEVVQLYRTYIQKIVDAGITPIVGLYNWDLPRNVSREFGGWTVQGLKIGVVVYRDERGPGSGSQNPKNFKKTLPGTQVSGPDRKTQPGISPTSPAVSHFLL